MSGQSRTGEVRTGQDYHDVIVVVVIALVGIFVVDLLVLVVLF